MEIVNQNQIIAISHGDEREFTSLEVMTEASVSKELMKTCASEILTEQLTILLSVIN